MNNFERAIIRMRKVEAACTEILNMAERDIKRVKKRRDRARALIQGYEKIKNQTFDSDTKIIHDHMEEMAGKIADQPEDTISIMGTGVKV